jgi:hypothetical protein
MMVDLGVANRQLSHSPYIMGYRFSLDCSRAALVGTFKGAPMDDSRLFFLQQLNAAVQSAVNRHVA